MHWKIIDDFDGRYRVSDTGIIQSCHKWGSRTNERVKWWTRKLLVHDRGYLYVRVNNSGGPKIKFIHRLVAESFIPNPKTLQAVNHLDGDKRNNKHQNLEWCTNKQNTKHALVNGLIHNGGSTHPFSKLSPDEVRKIRESDEACRKAGKRFGVCAQTISNVRRRIRYSDVF